MSDDKITDDELLHWANHSLHPCRVVAEECLSLRAENERLREENIELINERDEATNSACDNRERFEQLTAENARLRAIIDTLTAKAPATASLAVFLCSRCGEKVDTVYESGSGANVEHVCVDCATAGGGNDG